MPAYFSLSVEFSRYELDYDTVKILKDYLDHAGLKFKSGVKEYENDSIEEINDYNQKKLEENYTLGYTDDRTEDYKQACYEYGGFSEIRGFFVNSSPTNKEFEYILVIPEEEVRNDDGTYKADAVKELKELVKKLWLMPQIRTIQTGLESTDGIIPEKDVMTGTAPSAYPFAVVSQKMYKMLNKDDYEAEQIDAGGMIVIPKSKKIV